MACAALTILLVPTTTLRGAKSVSCRVFVVKIWVAVLASKGKLPSTVCATLTILLVPTTTLCGAKSVSCRVFVVKIWVAVLASKVKTAQHGLRYSNNSPGAHNDGPRCQVGQLSTLRGENLGGVFGLESENCPAWPALF